MFKSNVLGEVFLQFGAMVTVWTLEHGQDATLVLDVALEMSTVNVAAMALLTWVPGPLPACVQLSLCTLN